MGKEMLSETNEGWRRANFSRWSLSISLSVLLPVSSQSLCLSDSVSSSRSDVTHCLGRSLCTASHTVIFSYIVEYYGHPQTPGINILSRYEFKLKTNPIKLLIIVIQLLISFITPTIRALLPQYTSFTCDKKKELKLLTFFHNAIL